ncbi:MAG TPA: ComEC/Rec2 family competence protein [Propionibacteriaceae bacterium]|nr:ComEC/Rec2 family competence protein [Propionibacteriaceae bacterium]
MSSPAAAIEPGRPDTRLVWPFAATWVGAWLGTGGLASGWWWVALMGLVIVMLAVPRLRRPVILAAVLSLLAGTLIGSLGALRMSTGTLPDLARERAVATLQVRITGDARFFPQRGVRPPVAFLPASVVVVGARGSVFRQPVPVTLSASGERVDWLAVPASGSVVNVVGRLTSPDAGDPVAAILAVSGKPEVVTGPGWLDRGVNHFRSGLREAMGWSQPQVAGLLPSLVVGDTSGLDPAVKADFQATGLTHLTAVSGTNLTLLLAFLLTAARWAGVRGWWLRGLSVVGVVGFVLVCRGEPSVLRAAAMGSVALAAMGVGGSGRRGIRHLAAAGLLLLLVDPWLSRSVGFALSVSATGGIVWWGQAWQRKLSTWAPVWLSEAIAVPLAAQVATQPIVTWISGSVSVAGLAANALAGPFVGPATIAGLVAAFVATVSRNVALPFGWLAGWCVQPIIWIAQAGASLPAAVWSWRATPVGLAILAGLCAVTAVLVPFVLGQRWLCLACAVLVVAAGVREPNRLGWPGEWDVAFCDVGQGDATVLNAGPGAGVVVDVGPEPLATVRCLRSLGVRTIPLIVLTHFHDDHVAGLAGVMDAFPVGVVMVNPLASPSWNAQDVANAVAGEGAETRVSTLGEHMTVGRVDWVTVGVGTASPVATEGEGESSAENDSSIICRVQVGETSVIIPGDAEPAAQAAVMARDGPGRATVLKMPHHGSSRQDEEFWRATGAQLAVASAGRDNGYGHPAAAALRLARESGMEVARTDLQGSVTVAVRDGRLQVRTQGP